MKRSKRDRREQGRWTPLQPATPIGMTEERLASIIAAARSNPILTRPRRVRALSTPSLADGGRMTFTRSLKRNGNR
jgi:hypothetical protein